MRVVRDLSQSARVEQQDTSQLYIHNRFKCSMASTTIRTSRAQGTVAWLHAERQAAHCRGLPSKKILVDRVAMEIPKLLCAKMELVYRQI